MEKATINTVIGKHMAELRGSLVYLKENMWSNWC